MVVNKTERWDYRKTHEETSGAICFFLKSEFRAWQNGSIYVLLTPSIKMKNPAQSDCDSKRYNPSVAKPELDTCIILTFALVSDIWKCDSVFASTSLFAYKILGKIFTATYL